MKVYIIAEAGVNHNGSLTLAKQLVDAAKDAGADYVKFQTFQPTKLVSRFAPKADYQKRETGAEEGQLAMLERLSLKPAAFSEIKDYCDTIGIGFLSTPFDLDSISILTELDILFWKIPSGEVTNLPYLIAIAKTRKPVVLSTGMCEVEEIRAAMDVLRQYGSDSITLLHCNTEYPTPYTDVNLCAMQAMRETFGVPVGYSDHTQGIAVPIAAAALGAVIVEKHFTLDKTMEGPDHKASLEPDELKTMVEGIRTVEQALGVGKKTCSASENKNKSVARKSIVAARTIQMGEIFTEENICCKRPGTGISPMRWFEVLGNTAKRDFTEDELIEL